MKFWDVSWRFLEDVSPKVWADPPLPQTPHPVWHGFPPKNVPKCSSSLCFWSFLLKIWGDYFWKFLGPMENERTCTFDLAKTDHRPPNVDRRPRTQFSNTSKVRFFENSDRSKLNSQVSVKNFTSFSGFQWYKNARTCTRLRVHVPDLQTRH